MALTEIELRCGRLLDHHGVTLAFGDDQARSFMKNGVVPAIESNVPALQGDEPQPAPAEGSPPEPPAVPERVETSPEEILDADRALFEPANYEVEWARNDENQEDSEPLSLDSFLNE